MIGFHGTRNPNDDHNQSKPHATQHRETQVDVEILLPRMQGICEFMLTAQQDPDPEVSKRDGTMGTCGLALRGAAEIYRVQRWVEPEQERSNHAYRTKPCRCFEVKRRRVVVWWGGMGEVLMLSVFFVLVTAHLLPPIRFVAQSSARW